jgi:hypothetical protein
MLANSNNMVAAGGMDAEEVLDEFFFILFTFSPWAARPTHT